MASTLWLIGMMGSGKTAVGRLVADRCGCDFVDSDELVEQQAGRSIAEIWDSEGEPGFRRRERAAVASVAGRHAVVATGGGVILDEVNVRLMRSHGRVVWLTAGVEVLAGRVGAAENRPLLRDGDTEDRLDEILTERRDRYGAAAHDVVDTEDRTLDDIADEVRARWNGS